MSKIDKKLQKECRERAIKHVAKRRKLSQKEVRSVFTKSYGLNIYYLQIKAAVENWTVKFYNKEMQKRYL